LRWARPIPAATLADFCTAALTRPSSWCNLEGISILNGWCVEVGNRLGLQVSVLISCSTLSANGTQKIAVATLSGKLAKG